MNWIPSCREATEMMSQRLDRELSWSERIGLRLHLVVCAGCRATQGHLVSLRAITRAWQERHTKPIDPSSQGDSP